jgi:hypothetical protein
MENPMNIINFDGNKQLDKGRKILGEMRTLNSYDIDGTIRSAKT